MKVKAFGPHNIDISMIADLATINTYWEGVERFLRDLEVKRVDQLSHKQNAWLEKIAEQYEEQHEKLWN